MEERIRFIINMIIKSIMDSGTGSLCEWCGRTHFLAGYGRGDYEEGELEELLGPHKKNPDKYIPYYDDTAIRWAYFCGKQLVWGCPCNESKELKQYEDFIWAHRFKIARYLRDRVREEFEEKKIQCDLMEQFIPIKRNE